MDGNIEMAFFIENETEEENESKIPASEYFLHEINNNNL